MAICIHIAQPFRYHPCHAWHEQKLSFFFFFQVLLFSNYLSSALVKSCCCCNCLFVFLVVNFQFENTIYSCLQRLLCVSNLVVWSFHCNFGTCLTIIIETKKEIASYKFTPILHEHCHNQNNSIHVKWFVSIEYMLAFQKFDFLHWTIVNTAMFYGGNIICTIQMQIEWRTLLFSFFFFCFLLAFLSVFVRFRWLS